MNYVASVTDFFKNPKWLPNLLLGGVCMLIPFVGPLVLMGWHIGALYGRSQPWDMTGYPAFDFSNFGKYLERGVWPFLVQLVVSLVLVPVMWAVMVIPMFFMAVLLPGNPGGGAASPEPSGLVVGVGMAVMFGLYMIGLTLMILLVKPLMLRAIITQDFGSAFDFRFVTRFISLTWKEQVLATLFLMIAGTVLVFAGAIVLCIGMYFAIGLVTFSAYHLDRQIYDLYLARGGEPVPLSPKFNDTPPALPA